MPLQLTIVSIVILLASFYFGRAVAISSAAVSPAPDSAVPYFHDDVTNLLEPILTNLGFQELAMAVPSLSDASYTTWSGPSTLFAPDDASIRACTAASCSVARLLREHIVPGLFTHDYLKKLAFGTKIETMDPGRCITITSATDVRTNASKIFIGGVEITRPDLFNNGLLVIHGIQGFLAPLSPFSCNVERMNSLSFPYQPHHHHPSAAPFYLMRLMLRDAMLRLRSTGFSVLSLAMKVKYAELVSLNSMTVFAIDDQSIFSGSHSYVSSVRFHIVPNRLLPIFDLEKIPVGTELPTLEQGESLLVTAAGGRATPIRINYVRIKVPDVIRNLKIVVHSVYLPFPHLHNTAAAATAASALSPYGVAAFPEFNTTESCAATEGAVPGVCSSEVAPTAQVQPQPQSQPQHDHMFDVNEEHHGL
ncbi:hypothetical protein DCAR_0622753 [Daucus carota subsp. sativus]|uniref:FAS1 domain-containing protein n=1 Tax=Daucus carota subsp. sativus TaxID=79200 RepID=A0A164UU49_DAUCS|nr:PREDICTED: fasciclin-like arabinogalactan protein 21 [Daucus carota subsp. sativus]WOH03356.1 hypothetical protein DCAR_0622753 [Daucus carota subsp. sativus]